MGPGALSGDVGAVIRYYADFLHVNISTRWTVFGFESDELLFLLILYIFIPT